MIACCINNVQTLSLEISKCKRCFPVFTLGNPLGFDDNALLLLERPSPPNDKLFAFPLSALTTSRFLIFLKMFESSLIRAAEAIETVFRTRSFEHIEFLRNITTE